MRHRAEHDAVREARDALVIVASAAPVCAALGGIGALALGDLAGWARWLVGPPVVAAMLLGTLASALLIADRLGDRYLGLRPHTIRRGRLVLASVGGALLLIAGLPTTWPVVIGFAVVCALLGAGVVLGAMLDL